MKISFGMIVFNALETLPEGMLGACLDNVYEFAHEILISEGAVQPTKRNNGDATWASKDGRSTDGTLSFLEKYPDPQNKIKIYIKDGYWKGKLQMCNAYLEGMTGDYLFQLDSDEFYHKQDMEKIVSLLDKNPEIDSVHFYANHFFGGYDYCCDERATKWANLIPWKRVFKYRPGEIWQSHAPPVFGTINKNIITRDTTLLMGIKLYHYSFVERTQAEFKTKYYGAGIDYANLWDEWHKNHDLKLVHGDKTYEFLGEHPEVIKRLIKK